MISMGAFGEVLPRYENSVDIDPNVKDAWGIPVLRFNYKFGENENEDGEGHGRYRPRNVRSRGVRDRLVHPTKCCPKAGPFMNWEPRAWATIRKRRW